MAALAGDDLRRAVAEVSWYHAIELPGGIVTPGRWDTRSSAGKLPLPVSLAGMRCLDVGTWDGFWAFEMERRGAAEVVAIDVADASAWDWPEGATRPTLEAWETGGAGARTGFDIAHEALGSKVRRLELSVYDVSPDGLGSFDFVLVGSLLRHLRDPVRALSALRPVVRGRLLSADGFSITLSLLRPFGPAADLAGLDVPHWWSPNLRARRRLLEAAGFRVLRTGRPYFLKRGPGAERLGANPRALFTGLLGLPQAWVLAEPAGER
ncbi:MAG TPA: methyltransferase domain-containing protein [Gaiellaceae bacterium]|nr:methyltransferase domain-containing protein [Gaiellaceae bacterium]